jgi:hypothetical protein
MVQVMQSPQSDYRATQPRVARGDDTATFLARWLRVWVILLTVVVLVVVGYLIVITNTLASINGSLATANNAVTGAGQNVTDLPSQVDRINGSLDAIDKALKPIPQQATDIVASLTSTADSLANTDASLKATSGVLVTVLGRVNSISDVLIEANHPDGDCGGGTPCTDAMLGVQNIHQRVDNANIILVAAEQDAANILSDLGSINTHLTSVCKSPGAGLVGIPQAGC